MDGVPSGRLWSASPSWHEETAPWPTAKKPSGVFSSCTYQTDEGLVSGCPPTSMTTKLGEACCELILRVDWLLAQSEWRWDPDRQAREA